jgi:hypothetical protein
MRIAGRMFESPKLGLFNTQINVKGLLTYDVMKPWRNFLTFRRKILPLIHGIKFSTFFYDAGKYLAKYTASHFI